MDKEIITLGTYGFAVSMGALSFLSPCVFPLIPVYLTAMTGLTFADLSETGGRRETQLKIFRSSLSFSLGISLVFIGLGAAASSVGQFLGNYRSQIAWGAGGLVMAFGVYMVLSALGIVEFGFLNRTARFDDRKLTGKAGKGALIAAFFMGAAFAFGWSPCVGPFLGGILLKASMADSIREGTALLAAYSAGMCLPFIAVGLLFGRLTGFMNSIKRNLNRISVAAGALLIVFGFLLFTGDLEKLQQFALGAQIKAQEGFQGALSAGAGGESAKTEVTVIDRKGFETILSDGRGGPMLINFWATFCPPCRKEFPALVEIGKSHKKEGLRALAVSADDLEDLEKHVKPFLAKRNSGLEHYILKDIEAQDGIVRKTLKDQNWGGSLPATFLVNSKGKIVWRALGEFDPKELEKEIQTVLKGR